MAPVVDEPQRLRTPLQCWHESLASARTDPLVLLGSDGAFIATDRPVPVGTPLFLEVSAHGEQGGAEIDAVAIAGAGPEQGFAVRFVALDDDARQFITAHLAEEQRAAEPGATLVPRAAGLEVDVERDAEQDAEIALQTLAPPVAEPPAQAPSARILVPVAPIELSLDDTLASPLSVDDLASVVPEAQTPPRDDAIELGGFDDGAPLAAGEEAAAEPPTTELSDDALAFARGVELELELEPPAMASMPAPTAEPPPTPPVSAPHAAAHAVAPAPLPVVDAAMPRRGPAPVPETEQTIKWARASLVVAPLAPSSAARNPFATGDSGARPAPPAREQTERFAPAPGFAPATATVPPRPLTPAPFVPPSTSARGFLDEGPEHIERTERWIRPPPPRAPTPSPARADVDETRPWARANLATPLAVAPTPPSAAPAAAPPRTLTPSILSATPAVGLPRPTLPAFESATTLPRAPMPRIASMDVQGNAPTPTIEETQRWPTAQVRVANAPLELPVGDVPFAQPPDMQELESVGPGLDALFPADGSLADVAEPAFTVPDLSMRLEIKPALGMAIELDESFEPEPAPAPARPTSQDDTMPLPAAPGPAANLAGFQARDETAPLPAAPPSAAPLPPAPSAADAFGVAGGLLGADDDLAVGGNAADLFGGVEITDPGHGHAVPATAEDGFEAPDDIGPTLETTEPLELTALDDAVPIELSGPNERAVEPVAPMPASAQVAPLFDIDEAEPLVTAEIPAETQERLLKAAMSRPAAAAPAVAPAAPVAPAVAVSTDPFFDRPISEVPAPTRHEPRPTETQPMFTLGALGRALAPLPPPPPSMTRPPPLPARASSTPAVTPAPPTRPPVPPPSSVGSPGPQRTDPFFPSWTESAAAKPQANNPFAGLAPLAPASAAAPLLGNAAPAPAAQLAADTTGADTFFDDLAFEVAEQQHSAMPAPAEQWQVPGQPASEDIPTIVGNDELPTVLGRAATPSTANPWLVGEPAKKS